VTVRKLARVESRGGCRAGFSTAHSRDEARECCAQDDSAKIRVAKLASVPPVVVGYFETFDTYKGCGLN